LKRFVSAIPISLYFFEELKFMLETQRFPTGISLCTEAHIHATICSALFRFLTLLCNILLTLRRCLCL